MNQLAKSIESTKEKKSNSNQRSTEEKIETNKAIEELNETEKKIKTETESPKVKYKDGVTIDRLALYLYFTNDKVYNHNFDEVARDYGYKNGEKLKKTFSVFTNAIRRFGKCIELESNTKKLNRIEEYNWAIERLPEDKKQKATDEMKILESRLTMEE
ncbi:hypothetical protein [Algoriphagus limi]|uniref:Uncharacterized protein n=1 Tax=Algoriphagus limi TaxID=2975273 RepID=A0ABT2G916_9BACT|nr:hypothetical protein [Algoriphagus limi]MCS5491765.1 hypothetical protein [Algoriphagus limi]